jgi:phosphoribosylamine--glycine ligase
LREEGYDYVGFLFFGLMIMNNEPYVIEYNCRMGDPETEVVMPRLKTDLVAILQAAATGKLQEIKIEQAPYAAAAVVAVSGGYPGNYKTNLPIYGLDQRIPGKETLFHAGTVKEGDVVKTAGGRVLAAVSTGESIREAVEESIFKLELVEFEEMYYRKDIGYEFKNN